jgi:hypothetical protein
LLLQGQQQHEKNKVHRQQEQDQQAAVLLHACRRCRPALQQLQLLLVPSPPL